MGIRCFWIDPTNKDRRFLRRYASNGDCKQSSVGCHEARVRIEDTPALRDERGFYEEEDSTPYRDDPRWPTHCVCGYEFKPDDQWQLFHDHTYRRSDTGEETTLGEAPPGAMWNAW